MEEEKEIIHHFAHRYPLSWMPDIADHSTLSSCNSCFRFFVAGDAGYGCRKKCPFFLHEDCAEMPRQIRHPLHPSHPLTQQKVGIYSYEKKRECAVCEEAMQGRVYICSRGCDDFSVHLGCSSAGRVVVEADHEQQKRVMKHPSHPEHEMRLLRRKKRSCSFECDACGTTEKGNSYICIICEYWIHESCAALPANARFHHHHHSLSLAFHLPHEYYQYQYTCGVCDGAFRLRRWVYHCRLCRYVVHIKCAINTSHAAPSTSTNNEITIDDHKAIVNFPLNNIYEEIIKPFVKRESREMCIPLEGKEIVSEKYKFHKHHHPLSLITFSLSSTRGQIDEEGEEEEEDDDDIDNRPRIEINCDGCTMPICQKNEKSSSSNSYLSCDDCKYYLHLACFSLPLELSSHPLHQAEDHKLILRDCGKLIHDWPYCWICYYKMNGLYYACTECDFQSDIKCISLPETIKHNSHPQDHHYLKLVTGKHEPYLIHCAGCHRLCYEEPRYRCDRCKFHVCIQCALLPHGNEHGLEKHWLPLTYDAHIDHPSEFYCGSCEQKMIPKSWMYHCRKCDESFHPKCCPTTSGEYQNINFGMHQYYVSHHPHHPLRFQLITKKKRCDLCYEVAYDKPGFQCVSCNFIMCFYRCGRKHMDTFKVID